MDGVCVDRDDWTTSWGTFLLGVGMGTVFALAMVVLAALWYLAPQWETTPTSTARHWAGRKNEGKDGREEDGAEERLSTKGVKIAWWDEEHDQDVQESPEPTSLSLQGNRLYVGSAQYVLLGCKVRLAPRAKKRGPWWPRAPILVSFPFMRDKDSEHAGERSALVEKGSAGGGETDATRTEWNTSTGYPTACLALFLDTPNEKERWYTYLRVASGQVPRALSLQEEFHGFSGCVLGQNGTNSLKTRRRRSDAPTDDPGVQVRRQGTRPGGSNDLENRAFADATASNEGETNNGSGDVWVDVEDRFANDAETAFNLLLARLYFDATRSRRSRRGMRTKMQRKLSRLAMPDWLAPLRVVDLRFPRVPPRFTQVTVLRTEQEGDREGGLTTDNLVEPTWRVGAWMEAEPGTIVTVETSVDWRKSSKDKEQSGSPRSGSNVEDAGSEEEPEKERGTKGAWTANFAASLHRIPLRLELQVGALQGPMELWIPNPPSDGLFWRFSEKPHLELQAHPKLGRLRLFGRKKLAQKVSAWIARRLEREMGKAVVAPGAAAVRVPALVGVDRLEDMDWLDSEVEEEVQEDDDGSSTLPRKKMSLGTSWVKGGTEKATGSKAKKERRVKIKRRRSAEGESIFLAEQWQGKYKPEKGKDPQQENPPTHRRKKTWEEIEEEQEKDEVREWMKREESMSGMHEWGNGIPVMEGEVESGSSEDLLDHEEIKAATSSGTSASSDGDPEEYYTEEEDDESFVQVRHVPPAELKRGGAVFGSGNATSRSFRVREGFSKVRLGLAGLLRKNLSLESHKHRAEELSKKLTNKFGRRSTEMERAPHEQVEHNREN